MFEIDGQSQKGPAHIHQQHLLVQLGDPAQHGCLHGGAIGYRLVGVDPLVGLLAVEEVLDEGLHLRDTGGPAHLWDGKRCAASDSWIGNPCGRLQAHSSASSEQRELLVCF